MALVALSIAFTWPLGDVTDSVLPSHDDPLFSVWRLAWIAHQLPRNVTELFNTNIFYPLQNTLAYSDAMLLLGLLGAPLIWVGVAPLLVHNLLLIAAFVTAALAMMRLAAYFTSSSSAQVISGVIFAFAPYRVAHMPHLELLWTPFLPLALLALYHLLERPTTTRGLWLGLCVGLQGLCSVYYAVFLSIWLVPALLLARLHISFRWSARHVTAGLLGVATAATLLSPYVAPYASARQALGPRPGHELDMFSARVSDYRRLSPHNRISASEPRFADDERSLAVGAIASALAGIAILFVRTRATLTLAALSVIALDLSLGVHGLLLPLLGRLLPILDGFRAPARFGVFTLLGVSLLAGLGTQRLLAWCGSGRERVLLTTLLVIALLTEYWAAPIATYRVPTKRADVYTWLAAQPRTVVAALPMPHPGQLWGYETVLQYLSIFHWQPMVNGYSGYAPKTYLDLLHDVQDFPSDRAIAALRHRGVQLVLLHDRYGDPGQFDRHLYACHNRGWFSEVLTFHDVHVGRSAVCRLATDAAP